MADAGDRRSRKHGQVALAAIVAVLGSVLVVRGVNLQGFVWWILLTILAGTLMEGRERLSFAERFTFAPLVALAFTAACFGLYLILGYKLSSMATDSRGVDIEQVVARTKAVSSELVLLYAVVWICTATMILLSSVAAERLTQIAFRASQVDPRELGRYRRRVNLYVSIAVAIGVAVAYYAGR